MNGNNDNDKQQKHTHDANSHIDSKTTSNSNINSNTDSSSNSNSNSNIDSSTVKTSDSNSNSNIDSSTVKTSDSNSNSNIDSSTVKTSGNVITTMKSTAVDNTKGIAITSNSIIKKISTSLSSLSLSLSSSSPSPNLLGLDTVLLIVASNRPQYLEKCLNYVIQYHPKTEVPIIITEDGNNDDVNRVVQDAKEKFSKIAPNVPFLHIHNPSAGTIYENGYFNLAHHFKWALDSIFFNKQSLPETLSSINRVIILEEDLQISPDFYEYFGSLKTMLDNDKTLLCVSAFNDNGFVNSVKDNKFLYRSDFFPGLGWMLPRRIWEEYSPIWPNAYWDDWLREPQRRKGRHIIRPEVSRTFHYGRKGVSNAEFGGFLDNIKLNDEFVKFSELDLTYLELESWESTYINTVKNSPIVTIDTFNDNNYYKEVRILYNRLEGGFDSFVHIAHWAGVMDNIKANVPRTAYKGIVSTWKGDVKVHITPSNMQ